jgi:hypothetical protein
MWLTAVFFVAALAAGWSSLDERSALGPKEGEASPEKLGWPQSRTTHAAQEMQDYAYSQEAQFPDKMETERVEMEEDSDRQDDGVDGSIGAERVQTTTRLDAVREKRAHEKMQPDPTDRSGGYTSVNRKDVFRESYGEVKEYFGKVRQRLIDNIEP